MLYDWDGVDGGPFLARDGGLEGVTGRPVVGSKSARRMNCIGVNGEPLFVDGDDADCGLRPVGVVMANEGIWAPEPGSGVLGGLCGTSVSG